MALVTIKTRVRETMHADVERIAKRDDQSIADVLRRFIREGLEREQVKESR
jgi:hypothetical protein